MQEGHPGGFVHPSALHAYETVLDHVGTAHAMRPAKPVERLDQVVRAKPFAVDGHGVPPLEGNDHACGQFRRLL